MNIPKVKHPMDCDIAKSAHLCLDAVYIDAERRFKEIETETKRLHEDAKKYSEAVNGTLSDCMFSID